MTAKVDLTVNLWVHKEVHMLKQVLCSCTCLQNPAFPNVLSVSFEVYYHVQLHTAGVCGTVSHWKCEKKKKKQWWKKKRKTDFFSPSILLVSHNFEELSSWIKCAFFAQKVFRSFLTFWMFLPCVIQKFSEAQRKEWFLGLFRVEPNNHKLQRHLYNWFVVQLAALFP